VRPPHWQRRRASQPSNQPANCCAITNESAHHGALADGAFFAWTRGGYYFSAHAKGGTAALEAFMQAFPY
jgi:hypothetical protein